MCENKKCGGYCCERFMLNDTSMELLKKEFLLWKESKEGKSLVKGQKKNELLPLSYHKDVELIYPMLIDLGEFDWEPYDPQKREPGLKVHHYTCKHFNVKTRLCTIYDIRPDMCRNYPNGKVCLYKGCQSYPQEEEPKKDTYLKKRVEVFKKYEGTDGEPLEDKQYGP